LYSLPRFSFYLPHMEYEESINYEKNEFFLLLIFTF
jgi:hypothetical protein